MVFARERRGEPREVRLQHFDPAAAEDGEVGLPTHHVERCPLLRARLSEQERAVWELERRQADPLGHGRTRVAPAQPARDHQVDHQKEAAIQREDDPLAEPPHLAHGLPLRLGQRRRHRAEQKRARNAHAPQFAADHPGRDSLHVHHNVGQLGHRPIVRALRPGAQQRVDPAFPDATVATLRS